MKNFLANIISSVLSLCVLAITPGISQELTTATDYQSRAKHLVSSDSIEQASLLVDSALKYYSNNYELLMLSARIQAWKGNFPGSLEILDYVNNLYSENREILKLQTDIYYWQNNFNPLLASCEKYISQYTPDPDILFKKALALYETGKKEMSVNILESLIEMDQETTNAKNLLMEIRKENNKNRVSVQYLYSFFDNNRSSWQNLRLGYGHEGNTGTYLIYLSGGRMYDKYYQQVETDFYIKLTDWMRSRLYGNYTFQPVTLQWFYGGELIFKLPASFEISGGAQQLSYTEADFNVITGQLTKYLGNNYLALRSSLYFNKTNDTNFSALFRYRRYFENKQWLGISAGYGYLFNDHTQSDVAYQARSSGINLEYNLHVFRTHYLKWMAGYQQEDPEELPSRSMYTFFIEYNFLF